MNLGNITMMMQEQHQHMGACSEWVPCLVSWTFKTGSSQTETTTLQLCWWLKWLIWVHLEYLKEQMQHIHATNYHCDLAEDLVYKAVQCLRSVAQRHNGAWLDTTVGARDLYCCLHPPWPLCYTVVEEGEEATSPVVNAPPPSETTPNPQSNPSPFGFCLSEHTRAHTHSMV